MNNKNKILILIDYRNQFWQKTNYKEENFNIPLLKREFEKHGYKVDVKQFVQIDLKDGEYRNTYVIYQSAEDPNSFYKSYIEDCLLGLELKGAILIPRFHYFRAHHNKVFMEILRDVNPLPELRLPVSKYYGTYEEYIGNHVTKKDSLQVFKLSEGAQSKNVFLLKSKRDFLRRPKSQSQSFTFYYWLVDQIKPFLKKRYPNYIKKSHNRRKFIIQDFIPNLIGDYKVLVYGDNFYVLSRRVRPKDFRASGSGLFDFNREVPEGLLDYSKKCFEAFNIPFLSLDIAKKDDKFYLIEFQFVSFGNYTLEKSPFHFHFDETGWNIIEQKVILEVEFVKSIHRFILSSIPMLNENAN